MKHQTTVLLLALALWLSLSHQSSAKLPELDSIYYGTVRHNIIDELMAGSEDIVVQARLNGVVVAEVALASDSGDYVLKVPIDDGVDPRLTGTARRGETVRVFVRNQTLASEAEAIESVSTSGFSLPTEKGLIVQQDLTVAGDMGGASEEETEFIEWAEDNGLDASDVDALAALDSDGDGRSNRDEFLAGTDPNSSLSYFEIMQLVRFNDTSFLQFGPIIPERTYTIYRTPDLGDPDWTPTGALTPGVEAAHSWFSDNAPEASEMFYRVGIEIEQP